MPRRFTGKLLRFLFKHLELGTFGERLLWLDRQAGIFQMLWRHGNGCSTTPDEDSAVFMVRHSGFAPSAERCSVRPAQCWDCGMLVGPCKGCLVGVPTTRGRLAG